MGRHVGRRAMERRIEELQIRIECGAVRGNEEERDALLDYLRRDAALLAGDSDAFDGFNGKHFNEVMSHAR